MEYELWLAGVTLLPHEDAATLSALGWRTTSEEKPSTGSSSTV